MPKHLTQTFTPLKTAFSFWTLFKRAAPAPFLVLCVHQVSVWLTAGRYSWDEPLHLAGGAAIVIALFEAQSYLASIKALPSLPRWYAAWTLFAGAMVAGAVWEWYEYIRWITFDPGMDLTLRDTIKDFAMDALGAFVAAWVVTRQGRG